eukprot:COSAG05_NODE_1961_length_3777_cov_28.309407_2_plen_375_part_00
MIGSLGTINQVMMGRVMAKMLNDPNFVGSNSYERFLVKINSMFAAVFALNSIANSEGRRQTRKEMDDIQKQKQVVYLQLMAIGSCVAQAVLSTSLFSSITEGYTLGCFPLAEKAMLNFALALAAVGLVSMALTYFLIQTYMLPTEERPRRNARLKVHALLSALLMPALGGCSIFGLVLVKDAPVEVPQLRKYMTPPEISPDAREALEGHWPTIAATLISLTLSTIFTWVVTCKKLGGKLYIVMKLLSMLSWTIFSYGLCIAYLGWSMATDDFSGTFNPDASMLYTAIAIVGLFLMLVSMVGILGMRVYYKVRIVGQMLLRVFSIILTVMLVGDSVLCGFIGWYISQLDRRVDQDWDKYVRRKLRSPSQPIAACL